MNRLDLVALFAVSFVSLAAVACTAESSDEDTGATEGSLSASPSAAANTGPSTGGRCVERVMCKKNAHWDTNACTCVDNGSDTGSSVCVQTKACSNTAHWDAKRCECVPNVECVRAPCP